MTDRKLTCAACKSAITKGDIAGSDLEFGGELKATNQPTYSADADTDLVATVGTLDEYTPMVRTTGNQTIAEIKTFTSEIKRQINAITTYPPETGGSYDILRCIDKQGNFIIQICGASNANGTTRLYVNVRNSDGTWKSVTLAQGDVIQ